MRELKFKAFHKPSGEMYWFDLMWGNHGQGNGYIGMVKWGEEQSKPGNYRGNMVLVDPTDCEIMQFTGLLDKNDKEIYQGNIIKTGTDKLMVITWNERFASFCIERDGWMFSHWFGEAFEAKDCEIVGDVFQNAELIKEPLS